jgi:hypothetical protein
MAAMAHTKTYSKLKEIELLGKEAKRAKDEFVSTDALVLLFLRSALKVLSDTCLYFFRVLLQAINSIELTNYYY